MATLETDVRTSAHQEELELSRREFLNYAWLASLGIFLGEIGGVSYLFAMPRFRAGEFGGVFQLGPVSKLPGSGAVPERNDKGRYWYVRSEEGVYAIYVVCTHLGCLFQWRPTENRFICPCHGSQFSRTGKYLAGPAPRSLDSFVVRVVDAQGEFLAETPPEADGNGPVPTPVKDSEAQIIVDTGRRLFGKHKQ